MPPESNTALLMVPGWVQVCFIVDKSMVLTSVDTEGPAPDLRPGKVFEGFVIPEMLQNRILKNMPAADCVKAAGDKMRKLTA